MQSLGATPPDGDASRGHFSASNSTPQPERFAGTFSAVQVPGRFRKVGGERILCKTTQGLPGHAVGAKLSAPWHADILSDGMPTFAARPGHGAPRHWPPHWHPGRSERRDPPTARGIRGSGGRVSNPRPRAWEARALPTELPPHDAGNPLLNRCSCSLSLLPGRASHALVLPDCARNAVNTRNLHADEGAWLILGLLVGAHAVTIHTERESRICVPEQIHRCSGVRAQSRKQARVRCV